MTKSTGVTRLWVCAVIAFTEIEAVKSGTRFRTRVTFRRPSKENVLSILLGNDFKQHDGCQHNADVALVTGIPKIGFNHGIIFQPGFTEMH